MSVENIKSSTKDIEQLPYRFAREKKVLLQKNGEKLEIKTTSSVSIETLSELRSYLNKPLEIIWLEPETQGFPIPRATTAA